MREEFSMHGYQITETEIILSELEQYSVLTTSAY